ncbi:MAG: AhpC/TSA family protein [Candidatus Hydrogenedentes bacterium]|nr:AhpC/TSA family protein [Candidatus Hydrogenedentota bacterium]
MFGRTGLYSILFVALVAAALAIAASSDNRPDPAASAEEAKPIQPGSALPDVDVRTESGETVKITAALAGKRAAIVFYRGHWCPFCVKHLAELRKIAAELAGMDVQLAGISPDKPEYLVEAKKKADLDFPIYSDSRLDLARAMGVAFKLDPETASRYRDHLVESTGHDTGQLPVPAVFLIDESGKVAWVFSNPDYKVRLSNEDLIAAVKKAF